MKWMINPNICSKCRTLKTVSRTVSIQVQLVSYTCPPRRKLLSDQCKPMGTISSALNVTQGQKRSYQTSSSSINAKSLGTISARMFNEDYWLWILHRDTSVAIKQALHRSMPNLKAQSQLVCFHRNQITLNTVIKAESLYQLMYLQRYFEI